MSVAQSFKWDVDCVIHTPTTVVRIIDKYWSQEAKGKRKIYLVRCENCHNIFEQRESTIEDCNCPVCVSKKKIKWNINSVAALRPDLLHLFKDTEEAYKYGLHGHWKADFICPNCGRQLNKIIRNVVEQGLNCQYCSDGIPLGERLIRSVLKMLNEEYVPQQTFIWSENRRYDFYLPKKNAIIEVFGSQHYPDGSNFETLGGNSYEAEHKNDILKQQLANDNGITNYIIIDCKYSNYDYIIKNLKSNNFFNVNYDLENFDWVKCIKEASTSFVKTCGEMWEDLYSPKEMACKFQVWDTTVAKWLKMAQQAGFCSNYNKQNANRRTGKKCININTLDCFWSIKDCGKFYGKSRFVLERLCKNAEDGKHEIVSLEYYLRQNQITDWKAFFKEHVIVPEEE